MQGCTITTGLLPRVGAQDLPRAPRTRSCSLLGRPQSRHNWDGGERPHRTCRDPCL